MLSRRHGRPTGNAYDKYASKNPIERRLMAGFFAALDACSSPSTPPRRCWRSASVRARCRAGWPIDGRTRTCRRGSARPEAGGALADRAVQPGRSPTSRRLPFPTRDVRPRAGHRGARARPGPAAALAEIARVARRDIVVSVPREPIWRVANLARGKYVGALGNTPGHINHWSKASFAAFVGQHLAVRRDTQPVPVDDGRGVRPHPLNECAA